MPQMEKFGYASATTTVTSTEGSSSRARRAAEIPASLPPMAMMCMRFLRSGGGVLRPDDVVRRGGGRRKQRQGDGGSDRPAEELGGEERQRRQRRDSGEGVGENPPDGHGGVCERGRAGEPVGGTDVRTDRRRSHPPGTRTGQADDQQHEARRGHDFAQEAARTHALRRREGGGHLEHGVGEQDAADRAHDLRSEEHTSELQSLMRISYAVFCLKKKKKTQTKH